jgi:hypothetical protein
MRRIPEATVITLTGAERQVLEGLSRSGKSEVRMQLRSRIVLMAADGAATREISRELGCTIGTASKWRVRYARDRLAGLSESGARGPQPKYGCQTALNIDPRSASKIGSDSMLVQFGSRIGGVSMEDRRHDPWAFVDAVWVDH